jgi:pimeloyl-ACP methyl ester carboxylesterase
LIGDFIDQVIGAPTHAVAVGQSCGFVAAAATEYPESFSKVIYISPEVAAHNSSQWTLAGRLLRQAFWLAMVATPMRSVLRQVMTGEWENAEFLRRTVFDPHCIDPSKLERLEELAREPHALSACASLEAGFLTTRIEDFLPRVVSPTRFICGSESGDEYLRSVDRCASLTASSDVQKIPSARLWPHYEKPRQTNELLLSFLNDEAFGEHAAARSVAA